MTATDPLPRHQALKAFDPHRKDFTCKHEADGVPPIDAEADRWNDEALYVTRFALWTEDHDWKKAEALWLKAAERHHWKAMMNLASLYEEGAGDGMFKAASSVERDTYHAVAIVEEAMQLGIPAAFDKMGNYHSQGTGGVVRDGSRAWAFWQMAAEMGNPQALTHIGKALRGTYDNPKEGVWGNRMIALPMLECAVAQGFGQAAFELGVTLSGTNSNIGEDNVRALQALHEGVKFGSENAANYLFGTFQDGDAMVGHGKDPIRARRYKTLADALYHNPDLRFPNLDKVIPLPPAPLPAWDGKPESLVEAAKTVLAVPAPKATPGASRTGRAHIPNGYVITGNGQPSPDENPYNPYGPKPREARDIAHFTGYWLPQITVLRSQWQVDWNEAQVPWHFKLGEKLPTLAEHIPPGHGWVMWHYQGLPERAAKAPSHPFVRAGIVREVAVDGSPLTCGAGKRCPQTGIWDAVAAPEHPHRRTLASQWWRQGFFEEGALMPDARAWGMEAEGQIQWKLVEPGAWPMVLPV